MKNIIYSVCVLKKTKDFTDEHWDFVNIDEKDFDDKFKADEYAKNLWNSFSDDEKNETIIDVESRIYSQDEYMSTADNPLSEFCVEKTDLSKLKYNYSELRNLYRTYKAYPKQNLGNSDIANITVRYASDEIENNNYIHYFNLHFGSDGDYYAYLIDNDYCKIPQHYELVFDKDVYWADFIDDKEATYHINKQCNLKIWRAGNFGCIIQIVQEGKR